MSRRVRNEVYQARKSLKGTFSRIFLSEHLTKNAADLSFKARRLLREKKIYGTWTQNGLVYAKFSSIPTSRTKSMQHKSDLNFWP